MDAGNGLLLSAIITESTMFTFLRMINLTGDTFILLYLIRQAVNGNRWHVFTHFHDASSLMMTDERTSLMELGKRKSEFGLDGCTTWWGRYGRFFEAR